MQSPLDDVSASREKSQEKVLAQLGVGVSLVLLVFALGYLIIFPFHEEEGFSDVQWSTFPQIQTASNVSTVNFSILIRSQEKESTSYHVNVKLDGKFAATQNVTVDPFVVRELIFSLPSI